MQADNLNGESEEQELSTDIEDYQEAFADEYCRNMVIDMQAQIGFIKELNEKVASSIKLQDTVDFCASKYNNLGLFNPKITGLTSDSFFFNAEEYCNVFALTITEIKAAESGAS